MAEIWERYGMVLWIAFHVIVMIGSWIHLWLYLKCLGIIVCYDKKCKYRKFCGRCREGITEEEAKELLEYLDQLMSS